MTRLRAVLAFAAAALGDVELTVHVAGQRVHLQRTGGAVTVRALPAAEVAR